MKYDKILIAASMAMLVWSCSDDNLPENSTPTTTGGEVQFGVALEGATASRTVYGAENNNKFPILWENGDEVKVMATTTQRQEGTYKVVFQDSETASQAAAGTLVKQGDGGVQWGDEDAANFYSVYPAAQVTEMNVGTRTMTCYLDNNQNDVVSYDATTKTHTAKADMGAGFLYATNYGAHQKEGAVNLLYKPISTALRFKLQAPGAGNSAVTISKITLQAPANTPIAGKFSVTFPETDPDANPTIKIGAVDNKEVFDYITIYSAYESGGFLTLSEGDQDVELNAFLLIPFDKTGANAIKLSDGWSLQVVTADGVTFTKNLAGTYTSAASADATDGNVLVPGQIHRFKNSLPRLNHTPEFDVSKWMTYIPRNVYLSEISIPGSWNSVNSDFQGDVTNIATQYSYGVRAFHLDCRWKITKREHVTYAQPDEIGDLSVADGGETFDIKTGAFASAQGKVMRQDATAFADYLKTVTDKVNEKEYMVVFCTWAQNSYVKPDKTWMQAVSEACASNATVYDARNLTPSTLVNDVLGKVIVIVNCESKVADLDLPADSKCLFVNVPMTLTEANFNFTASPKYNIDYLYNSSKTSTGVYFANTQAQISSNTGSGIQTDDRGYAPTLAMRQEIGGNILSAMQTYYNNKDTYPHNAWIYLGLGGYLVSRSNASAVSGSYATVAKTMNDWIGGIVDNMSPTPDETQGQTPYYPVGLVMMNFVNDYKDTVEKILRLNNLYQKVFDPYSPAWPDMQTGGNTNGGGGDTSGGDTDGGDSGSQTTKSAGSFTADTNNWEVF